MAPRQVLNFAKDVIYLFHFAGFETVSSNSPYCIKVEAFCRVHNLQLEIRINIYSLFDFKFQKRTTNARGANGLLPFIELNGMQTCDSEAICKRLTEEFHLQNYANAREEGIGYAFERMIENHAIHPLFLDLSRSAKDYARLMSEGKVPGFLVGIVSSLGGWYFRRMMLGNAKKALGAFTDAEYDEMLRHDLLQLQNVLGDKPFLMGGTPTKVDCVAFAHIGFVYYILPNARNRIHVLLESKELCAMKEYLERTKKTLFGDDFKDKK